MKKIIALCLCLLMLGVCFTGCDLMDNLFKTSSYVSYDSFAKKHEAGMTKQEVFDKLGCPKMYTDSQGKCHTIESQNDFRTSSAYNDSVLWVYTCYEYSDPANPYQLVITFDSEGRSVKAEMTAIPGG